MIGLRIGRGVLVVASLITGVGYAGAYTLLSYKWAPGANTAQAMGPNLGTPGGATWSVMASGLGIEGSETHGGALTSSLTGMSSEDEIAILNSAMNAWASVSNFTNLGMVADGGVNGGASQATGGHLGDIRFGAIGGFGAGVLAHAWTPGTEGLVSWGTLGGDTHFNTAYSWGDGTGGTYDFYTVALHEIGHALGVGHSAVSGSVMEPVYAGVRRTLHADDVAAIQAIYGAAPVPEPATMVLAGAALLAARRRRRNA